MRQASQLSITQSPLVSSSSVNDAIMADGTVGSNGTQAAVTGSEGGQRAADKADRDAANRRDRALALMMQPSIDYG